jgi:hypothetical protein
VSPTHLENELADAALEQVVRDGTAQLLIRVGSAFAAEQAWVDGLRAVAYELRDFLIEDPVRARAMVLEAPFGTPETRAVRDSGAAALAALIDLGRKELTDADSLPSAISEITAGAIFNRIHVAVESGDPLDDQIVRELMYSAAMPYLGVEAALAELEAPRPRRG